MIEELTFSVSDEPGALYAVLKLLAEKDVNVLAALTLGGTVADFAVVVLICNDVDQAAAVLRDNGFRFQRRDVIAVGVIDQPGRLAQVTRVLADAAINVRHLYHTEYSSPSGLPLTILSLSDNKKGSEILRSQGFEVIEDLVSSSLTNSPRR